MRSNVQIQVVGGEQCVVCEKHRVKRVRKLVRELERNRAIADKERWSRGLYLFFSLARET